MLSLANVELPTPPRAALRLVELCRDLDCDMREIEEVILTDAALSARLLRVANSAFYGQQRDVSTLSRAVIVLGTSHVMVVALGFHLVQLSRTWQNLPINLGSFWQGNVLRACLARQIAFSARTRIGVLPAEAFLVGLLQDFAVLIMAREIGEPYSACVEAGGFRTTSDTVAAEMDATGSNHAALAYEVFEHWQFPPSITCAIGRHHERPQPARFSDRTAVLWQIGYLVGAAPFGIDTQTAKMSTELCHLALAGFDLNPNRLGQAFYRAVEDYEALRPVFDGVFPADADGADLVRTARCLAHHLLTLD